MSADVVDGIVTFGRIGPPGAEIPVARRGGETFDLRPITDDIDGAFLAADGIARATEWLQQSERSPIDLGDARIGAPIRRPMAVICIGQNYAAHAAESGSPPPDSPIVFLKHPNAVVGPNDPVPIPRGATTVDWEVELGVVIGSRAHYLDAPADAHRHIAGLVTSNDVSERTFQRGDAGGQWTKGKSCEAFNPVGPWLVPLHGDGDIELRLRSWVNGSPRQDSTTADMIFDVHHLIWYLSQFMALEPGDLINTGTPEGVALSGRFPYLEEGDIVEIEVEGLGRQRQEMVASSPGGGQPG